MWCKLHGVKVFLIDLDGTVYLGDKPIEGALETVDFLRQVGKKICFLTNNSSKSKTAYIDKLAKMGLEICEDEIYTSQDATIAYLKKKFPLKKVFLLGNSILEEEFLHNGIELAREDADILVLAYDTELTYEKLCVATKLLRKGVSYIATHPDKVCPSPEGGLPDAGSFISLLFDTTGRKPDIICGKPSTVLADSLSEKFAITKDEFAMVGDRLYTDLEFALSSGMTSVLVLSGESSRDDYEKYGKKADFVFDSIRGIKVSLMRR